MTIRQEEKDRIIDLSLEDPDSVGAFVYYLYNLNYDAALFREHGDHLSLHAHMCILGDKYEMRPLQDLATEKFKKQTTNSLPTGSDLANAALCAYDAPGATTVIRKVIVKLAIDQKQISTEISDEPANDFERAMQACPGLCLDIVKVQQSMIPPSTVSYRCPNCQAVSTQAITLRLSNQYFRCYNCSGSYLGYQWAQYPVS